MTGPLWNTLAVTLGIGAVLFAIGLAFAIGMARQIARGEQVQRLLLTELNHRVKNTLAIVQSVAAQTFRETSDANDPTLANPGTTEEAKANSSSGSYVTPSPDLASALRDRAIATRAPAPTLRGRPARCWLPRSLPWPSAVGGRAPRGS